MRGILMDGTSQDGSRRLPLQIFSRIKAGRLRAIGVTSRTRSALMPDAPTLAERGLPTYGMEGWIAMIAPAGLSKAAVDKLCADTRSILKGRDVQESLAAQGMKSIGTTPKASAQYLKTELDRYARIVKEPGVSVQ